MSTLSVNKITDLIDFTFPPTTTLSLVGFNASGKVNTANLTITGTSGRITGDFSNATIASRVAFQTSTINGNTNIHAIPNGTGVSSSFEASTAPIGSAASVAQLFSLATDVRLAANVRDSGTFVPMTFYTGGLERARIDTSGNVGIGTSAPAVKLDVVGTQYIRGAAAAGAVLSTTADPTSGTNGVSLAATFSTGGYGPIKFFTTNAEAMRIDTSGNVGIGVTPSAKLDVAGSQWIRGAAAAGAILVTTADPTSGTNGVSLAASFATGSYGPLKFFTSNAEAMRIDSSGNVGIGTGSPIGKLAAVGGSIQLSGGTSAQAGLRVQYLSSVATISGINHDNNAYNPIAFYTSGTEAIRIGTSGQLGIAGANYGTSGQVLTSGGASAAPTWTTISSGSSAKAWARWDGASGTRTSSFNVSSITRSSAGQYIVNFTTAMADANYAPIMSCAGDSTVYNGYGVFPGMTSAPTTTSFAIWTKSYSGTATDPASVQIAVFGN